MKPLEVFQMLQINQQIPVKQAEGAVSRQHRKIERIRARASYILFQELYDFLEERPAIADILRKFYCILDAKLQNAALAAGRMLSTPRKALTGF